MSTWNMPPGVSTADIPGQDGPLVVTEYIAPPIGTRSHDWMAYIRDQEDGTGKGQETTGYGPTECEALRDLCEQLAARYLESK